VSGFRPYFLDTGRWSRALAGGGQAKGARLRVAACAWPHGIVGVGIFLAPSQLAQLLPGLGSALAFVATAALLLPVAWTYGRLGSAYPEDGGPYVWARAAFGDGFGFGVGFISYASAVLSTSAVVSGLGQYLAPELGFVGAQARLAFQLGAAASFAAIALLGLRLSAWVWSALTLLKLIPLGMLVALSVPHLAGGVSTADVAVDFSALERAALVAVFPLQGFEIVAVPSGEARRAERSVLRATLLSLLLAAALYVLLQTACVLALPSLSSSASPIVEAGSHYSGGKLSGMFAAGTNVSAIGIAFGMFAMTPRYLSALGTPKLLGTWLGAEKREVPWRALLITALLIAILVSSSSLTGLFVLSSLAVLAQYSVSALSLFRLASRKERGLGVADQWLAPLSLASISLLAQAAEWRELATLALILLAGLTVLGARRALLFRRR